MIKFCRLPQDGQILSGYLRMITFCRVTSGWSHSVGLPHDGQILSGYLMMVKFCRVTSGWSNSVGLPQDDQILSGYLRMVKFCRVTSGWSNSVGLPQDDQILSETNAQCVTVLITCKPSLSSQIHKINPYTTAKQNTCTQSNTHFPRHSPFNTAVVKNKYISG